MVHVLLCNPGERMFAHGSIFWKSFASSYSEKIGGSSKLLQAHMKLGDCRALVSSEFLQLTYFVFITALLDSPLVLPILYRENIASKKKR